MIQLRHMKRLQRLSDEKLHRRFNFVARRIHMDIAMGYVPSHAYLSLYDAYIVEDASREIERNDKGPNPE